VNVTGTWGGTDSYDLSVHRDDKGISSGIFVFISFIVIT